MCLRLESCPLRRRLNVVARMTCHLKEDRIRITFDSTSLKDTQYLQVFCCTLHIDMRRAESQLDLFFLTEEVLLLKIWELDLDCCFIASHKQTVLPLPLSPSPLQRRLAQLRGGNALLARPHPEDGAVVALSGNHVCQAGEVTPGHGLQKEVKEVR